MPIYMDRHDMEGATAKAVADAHLKDLKLQDKYGVKLLTSRICDQAEPDQILVAAVIRDLCLGKQFSFSDRGESTLKGFDQPFKMYEVQWQ